MGKAVLTRLGSTQVAPYAGVRDVERAKQTLGAVHRFCMLDFERGIYPEPDFEAVFLMRPPRLTDPDQFERFLRHLDPSTKIVFLSVMGAETRLYLPHARIERRIVKLGLRHIFIRPGYFMENLTTTLWEEMETQHRIFLPAGSLKLQWIAVTDVAEAAAIALTQNIAAQGLTVCNNTSHGFAEVAKMINAICATNLTYRSPSLLKYVGHSLRQGKPLSFILVMLLLHYLPRFSRHSVTIESDFERFVGRRTMSLVDFITLKRSLFEQLRE